MTIATWCPYSSFPFPHLSPLKSGHHSYTRPPLTTSHVAYALRDTQPQSWLVLYSTVWLGHGSCYRSTFLVSAAGLVMHVASALLRVCCLESRLGLNHLP